MQWDPSHTFRRLLITQIAVTLIYPVVGDASHLTFLLGLFLIVAIYGGVMVTVAQRWKLWTSVFLGGCFLIGYWVAAATDNYQVKIYSPLFGALFYWFIAFVIMKYLFFFRSRVDLDLIFGSISAYLLLGNGFAEFYVALAMVDPDSFRGVEVAGDLDSLTKDLSYFSFVTLTTLGYGDIQPVHHLPRVMAYSEAIVGQLYLTILVARLVGTYIAQYRDE